MSVATMMKCGHAANATHYVAPGVKEPVCVICYGLRPGADEPVGEPDLTGRTSRCGYCRREVPSAMTLPFFQHKPDSGYDEHYCGCRGWD